ncbi:unnamed protein product, partial [Durusdinium trenchii]
MPVLTVRNLAGETCWGPKDVALDSAVAQLREDIAQVIERPAFSIRLLRGTEMLPVSGRIEDFCTEDSELSLQLVGPSTYVEECNEFLKTLPPAVDTEEHQKWLQEAQTSLTSRLELLQAFDDSELKASEQVKALCVGLLDQERTDWYSSPTERFPDEASARAMQLLRRVAERGEPEVVRVMKYWLQKIAFKDFTTGENTTSVWTVFQVAKAVPELAPFGDMQVIQILGEKAGDLMNHYCESNDGAIYMCLEAAAGISEGHPEAARDMLHALVGFGYHELFSSPTLGKACLVLGCRLDRVAADPPTSGQLKEVLEQAREEAGVEASEDDPIEPARIATPDGKKAVKLDLDFLKHTIQYMDKKRLNEREEVFGYTSLSLACSVGHVKVVNMLLEARADLESSCNLGNAALQMASRAGHTSVVRALLVHKAALEAKNVEGWTPLIWASMNGQEEVVATLLGGKAKVQERDAQGLTALMWATRHGHVLVMKSLLATGPDLGLKDFDGHTVMHHARQQRAARKMLQQFEELNRQLLHSAKSGDVNSATEALEAGAFVDALDDSGSSPLLLAASQRDFTMVRLLARHGADLSLEASRGNSPWLRSLEYRTNIQEVLRDAVKANRLLMSSAKEGYWRGVFQAIEHGAWLDLPDEAQKTSLAWASTHGSAMAARKLVEARASVGLRDTCGWTALAWAAHNNWPKVASVLQYHKADVNTRTFTG